MHYGHYIEMGLEAGNAAERGTCRSDRRYGIEF
jgi:hypothetical protein